MKILDIYPDHCWSFYAENAAALDGLRLAMTSPEAQNGEAIYQDRGRGYRIIGKAVNLDLATKFFDRVVVHYAPATPERALLEQRRSRWLKEAGQMVFEAPDEHQGRNQQRPPERVSLWRRIDRTLRSRPLRPAMAR
jgi:hypothetical protein